MHREENLDDPKNFEALIESINAVAEKYKDEIAKKWGFSNIEFKKGYIEDLASAAIADGTIDLVISNCVINLSPDKDRVFSEI